MLTPDEQRRARWRAQANIEELAVRCVSAAVVALGRDAAIDERFEWSAAGKLAVEIAVALRCRAAEVCANLDEQQLAILAERIARGDSAPPS